ncbi:hypothetical protein K470DRAFT_262751 [Piedraia hortae CBS 480.64]|uniref:POPLD domain-containing protein n=1 Tax=Piedraia hortae CBS 480.64 TaxID=1314780 RepID=A0A6A7C559_9PEZI|nr:hypothetical protein K470DRAFT_262751 [Piedraia hortae CBS 480.64]
MTQTANTSTAPRVAKEIVSGATPNGKGRWGQWPTEVDIKKPVPMIKTSLICVMRSVVPVSISARLTQEMRDAEMKKAAYVKGGLGCTLKTARQVSGYPTIFGPWARRLTRTRNADDAQTNGDATLFLSRAFDSPMWHCKIFYPLGMGKWPLVGDSSEYGEIFFERSRLIFQQDFPSTPAGVELNVIRRAERQLTHQGQRKSRRENLNEEIGDPFGVPGISSSPLLLRSIGAIPRPDKKDYVKKNPV